MTAAALSCAVTSDPYVFQSEPVCTSNYSSLGHVIMKGSLFSLLFLNFQFL